MKILVEKRENLPIFKREAEDLIGIALFSKYGRVQGRIDDEKWD